MENNNYEYEHPLTEKDKEILQQDKDKLQPIVKEELNNEKYYQPTIEEFHVGFECEAKVLIEENKCEWRPFIIKQPNYEWMNVHTDGEYKTYTVPECIRVKYLDREDIESCGWVNQYVCKDDEECTLVEGYKMELNKLDEYVMYPDKEKWVIYFSHVYNEVSGNSEYGILFQGTIKNKSELKQLMQQLNII